MKYFISILIGMLLTVNSFGQQTMFSKVFYDSVNAMQGYAMAKAIDNGFVIAGSYNSDALILKTDDDGDIVWKKNLEFNLHEYSDTYFNNIIITYDSCYLFAGNSDGYNIFAKTNLNGDTLWSRILLAQENFMVRSVVQSNDSGFMVVGNNSASTYIYIVRFDKNGNVVWSKMYSSGTRGSVYVSDIAKLYDGSYVVVGGLTNETSFLMKFLDSGEVLGGKQYINSGSNSALDIKDVMVNDTGLVLSAYLYDREIYMIGTDDDGIVNWIRGYGDFNFDRSRNTRNHFIMHKSNDDGFFSVVSGWGMFDEGGRFFKTDSEGNEVFTTVIRLNAMDVKVTDDNGYFIMGNGPVWPNKDIYPCTQIGLIRLDSAGHGKICAYKGNVFSYNAGFTVVDQVFDEQNFELNNVNFFPLIGSPRILIRNYSCVDVLGSMDENLSENSVKVFPNPSTGTFTVSLTEDISGRFYVYNNLGQLMFEQKLDGDKTTISLSENSSGVCFYKFITRDKKVITGKMVLVH